MKRQNRFLIALLSAGITFSALTAFVGTDHWKRGYWYEGKHHQNHHHHHDHDHDGEEGGGEIEQIPEGQNS